MSLRGSARSPEPRPYKQQRHYRDASPGGVALTIPPAKFFVVSEIVDMLLSDRMTMGRECSCCAIYVLYALVDGSVCTDLAHCRLCARMPTLTNLVSMDLCPISVA